MLKARSGWIDATKRVYISTDDGGVGTTGQAVWGQVATSVSMIANPTTVNESAHTFDTGVEFTEGRLLDVMNNGVSKFSISYSGEMALPWLNSNFFGAVLFTRPLIAGGAITTTGFQSATADSLTPAFDFDTNNEFTTAGSKLISLSNQGTEKLWVDKEGVVGAGGLVIPAGHEDKGIAFGDAASSDFGWHSLSLPIIPMVGQPNAPTFYNLFFTTYGAYKFAVNDEVYLNFAVPHDYAPNTDIMLGCTFVKTTDTGTPPVDAEPIHFNYYYGAAIGHNQSGVLPTGTNEVVVTAAPAVNWQVHESITAPINLGAALEPGSLFMIKLSRIHNGGTDSLSAISVTNAIFRYQSTGVPTKNAGPNFYT